MYWVGQACGIHWEGLWPGTVSDVANSPYRSYRPLCRATSMCTVCTVCDVHLVCIDTGGGYM